MCIYIYCTHRFDHVDTCTSLTTGGAAYAARGAWRA